MSVANPGYRVPTAQRQGTFLTVRSLIRLMLQLPRQYTRVYLGLESGAPLPARRLCSPFHARQSTLYKVNSLVASLLNSRCTEVPPPMVFESIPESRSTTAFDGVMGRPKWGPLHSTRPREPGAKAGVNTTDDELRGQSWPHSPHKTFIQLLRRITRRLYNYVSSFERIPARTGR